MLDADALRDKIENGHPSLVPAYKKLLALANGDVEEVVAENLVEAAVMAAEAEEKPQGQIHTVESKANNEAGEFQELKLVGWQNLNKEQRARYSELKKIYG